MFLFSKDKSCIEEREQTFIAKQRKLFAHHSVPLYTPVPEGMIAQEFAAQWFDLFPYTISAKCFSPEDISDNGHTISFLSHKGDGSRVSFVYHLQPKERAGRRVAQIHIMHWNGRLSAYERIIGILRRTVLPVSTFVHVPAGRGAEIDDHTGPDYAFVGPDVYGVINTAQAHITDVISFARYLKEEKGFDEVGLFTYSIGSMIGMIASMASSNLFSYGIFHMVADDFAEAVMHGESTGDIARVIRSRMLEEEVGIWWSVISPGAYAKHFGSLPQNTRIVQAEYDHVFGEDNIRRFNEKIAHTRPDIELDIRKTGHTTIGLFPEGLRIMRENIRFVYERTPLEPSRSFWLRN